MGMKTQPHCWAQHPITRVHTRQVYEEEARERLRLLLQRITNNISSRLNLFFAKREVQNNKSHHNPKNLLQNMATLRDMATKDFTTTMIRL
mmetsp:Transcript_2497/g.4490  ORF Transcript_2497/g.4490 Transcript_2497/m.4490 type:complete len:91 (+) Transcript_2497:554-826(+)